MPKNPAIPMLPSQLPQQRIHEVVNLPSLPTEADVWACDGMYDHEPAPKRRPRKLTYLCQVEWAWSPNHVRLQAYHLHRSRSCWYLWSSLYDDNWERWDWKKIGWAQLKGINERAAAMQLLRAYWQSSVSLWELEQFHWINEHAFLGVPDIMAVAREVWG
jgi:hypothetical protein